jgi:FkbM family methyltransferase
MYIFEKICKSIRHGHLLGKQTWLWNFIRPSYRLSLFILARHGLERTINGTDSILILPKFNHSVSEIYEPETWRFMMAEVKPGDIVADVGAYIGLYTVALAKRIAPTGKVFAFEPDARNFIELEREVTLNKVWGNVMLIEKVVSSAEGLVSFKMTNTSFSHIASKSEADLRQVESISLDSIFINKRLDILKIDVEGHEEDVLKSGRDLLSDRERCPRAIYLEAHPYAWPEIGTTDESLLNLLVNRYKYKVMNLQGGLVTQINSYGWLIALKS